MHLAVSPISLSGGGVFPASRSGMPNSAVARQCWRRVPQHRQAEQDRDVDPFPDGPQAGAADKPRRSCRLCDRLLPGFVARGPRSFRHSRFARHAPFAHKIANNFFGLPADDSALFEARLQAVGADYASAGSRWYQSASAESPGGTRCRRC
jgi:hypothetical protein